MFYIRHVLSSEIFEFWLLQTNILHKSFTKKKQIYLAKNNTEVKVIFLDKFYYFILQHKFSVKGKGNGSNEKAERSNVDEGKLQQQHWPLSKKITKIL